MLLKTPEKMDTRRPKSARTEMKGQLVCDMETALCLGNIGKVTFVFWNISQSSRRPRGWEIGAVPRLSLDPIGSDKVVERWKTRNRKESRALTTVFVCNPKHRLETWDLTITKITVQ